MLLKLRHSTVQTAHVWRYHAMCPLLKLERLCLALKKAGKWWLMYSYNFTSYSLLCANPQSPPKANKETKPMCKSKEPLLYASLQTLHVHCIGITRELWAHLELGFDDRKGEVRGFCVSGPLIGWHLSRGVLVSVCWQVILSTAVGMLGISIGWSVLGWCSSNLSLWFFLQPGIASG